MQNVRVILESDCTYHIYNRANGNEQLFRNDENFRFFLEKYKKYINPIAETYCYCLMPNHFHFLIKIRSENVLQEVLDFPKFGTLEKSKPKQISLLLSKQFSNLFSSYTQAFNKQNKRMGSLFMKNFKRKRVKDADYLLKLVHYIHYNPVKARIVAQPEEWKFSSYSAISEGMPTMVNKEVVIDWFENKRNFLFCHREPPQFTGIDKSL